MAALTAYSCKMQQLWSSWMRTHWDTEVHKIEGHRFLYLLSVHSAQFCNFLVNLSLVEICTIVARAHNSTNYRTSSCNRKSNKLWQTLHQRSTAYYFKFLLFTIFLYSKHFWELFIIYRLSTYQEKQITRLKCNLIRVHNLQGAPSYVFMFLKF